VYRVSVEVPSASPHEAEAGADAQSAARPPWLVVAVVALVAAAGVGGFLGGVVYESSHLTVSVSATVDMTGPASKNISLSTNCHGASQVSYDGWWACSVTLQNLGSSSAAVLSITTSLPVSNLAESPPLPVVIVHAGEQTMSVTGELGYSGSLTVTLGLYP